MTKGIYKITNERTGETYIGQTNNLYYREKQHREDLNSGTHHNRGMQQDYNKGDTFSFEVLEEIHGTRQELHNREKTYINKYNSFYAGYNQTPGGEYDQYEGRYEYGGGRKHSYNNQGIYSNRTPKANYSKSNNENNTIKFTDVLGCVFGILTTYLIFTLFDSPGNLTWQFTGFVIGSFAGLFVWGLFFSISQDKPKTKPKIKNSVADGLKTCPKCKRQASPIVKKCPWCGHKF